MRFHERFILCIACASFVAGCSESSSGVSDKDCPDKQVYNEESKQCEPVGPMDENVCSDDKACKNGQICEQGKCVDQAQNNQPGECETSDDCKDGKICKEHTCVPSPVEKHECETSDDCENDKICEDHACVPSSVEKYECETSDDCDDGKICEDHACVPSSVEKHECETSDDCDDGKICEDHACVPSSVEKHECETSDDCVDGKICENYTCVTAPENKNECETSDDCKLGESCVENKCQMVSDIKSCKSTDDCESGLICINEQCRNVEISTDECQVSADCTDGKLCVNHACVMPECASDDACKDSEICVDSFCVADPLYCSTDNDCETGLFCSSKHCVDPSIECYENSECDGTKQCIENKCQYECVYEDDCSDGKICKANTCRYECTNDNECDGFDRCIAHKCQNSCTKSEECKGTAVCRNNQCQPECALLTEAVDCKDNANGSFCSNGQCRECRQDSNCGQNQVCLLYHCETSKDVVFPCIADEEKYTIVDSDGAYDKARNEDGSINICKLGYRPAQSEIDAKKVEDQCMPLYQARGYDFYGDGIDSNCDGYDYDLSTAIFVNEAFQGNLGGKDENSGGYDPETNLVYPKATLNSALSLETKSYIHNYKSYSYYPDIIVSKNVTPELTDVIAIPGFSSEDLQVFLDTKTLMKGQDAYDSLYEYHVGLIRELSDSSLKAQNYGFYRENLVPKQAIRIYGGFDYKGMKNTLWTRSADDRTKLSRSIGTATEKVYSLIEPASDENAISFYIDQFDLTLRASTSGISSGSTLAGINCGLAGCRAIAFKNSVVNISAPSGVSFNTREAAAGANGYNGINGVYAEKFNDYTPSKFCTQAQTCSGSSLLAGTGGCGGYADSDVSTLSVSYDGNSVGGNGANGASVTVDGEVVKGGKGGAGLNVENLHDSCKDDSVASDKGTGKSGENGEDGLNGSKKNLKFELVREGANIYVDSHYAQTEGLSGSAGAPGGGGGGGSVYQSYSSMTGKDAWVSAGSGGNGGCGGIGGQAGGIGGSVIGIIAKSNKDQTCAIRFDHSVFNLTSGNGGFAQNGSAGGIGGKGGLEKGYRDSNLTGCSECFKATKGGQGGNGGHGGAGAGGAAGLAMGILFTCNRPATDNCVMASLSDPCFSDQDLSSLVNCGYEIPEDVLRDMPSYFNFNPGKNVDDSKSEDGIAETKMSTSGDSIVVKTRIEK